MTLRYTCAAGDIGSKVRVEVNGKMLEGIISQVHDPKPLPSPDRVPRRGEVYERVWAPLSLGAVQLGEGRTRISITALNVAGKRVMDLKAIELRRLPHSPGKSRR